MRIKKYNTASENLHSWEVLYIMHFFRYIIQNNFSILFSLFFVFFIKADDLDDETKYCEKFDYSFFIISSQTNF